MAVNDFLDFSRSDVFSTTDDCVVSATFNEEETSGIQPTTVTGVEPAIVIDDLAAFEVFTRNLFATYPDCAWFTKREFVAFAIANLQVDVRENLAN